MKRFLRRLRPPASTGGDPVSTAGLSFFFLAGFGRSGTNWIGNLLNLHPHILCDGEFHFQHFYSALDEFTRYDWQIGSREPVRSVAAASVERLVRDCLGAFAASKPGAHLIGDRSPRPLRNLLPGARTIYACRDGRDVVVSYTFHHLRVGQAHHFPPHLRETFRRHQAAFRQDPAVFGPHNPGLLADEDWVRATARFWAWRIEADVRNGAGVDTPTLLNIRYERLHADPDGERVRMYRFLDADPAQAAPLAPESGAVPGVGRRDRPTTFRKGQIGEWRQYSGGDFDRWMAEEAGTALTALGYESVPVA